MHDCTTLNSHCITMIIPNLASVSFIFSYSPKSTYSAPPTEQMKKVVIDDGNVHKTSQRPQRE